MSITQDKRIDLWEPRRVMTLAQARHRSNLVGLLRMLFMAGAAISAGCFVGPIIGRAVFLSHDTKADPVSGVTMLNPRFTGHDSSGNSYTLIATTAKRRIDELGVVDLERPVMEDGMGGELRAQSGVFDRDNQVLTLEGQVELNNASGYQFTSQNAVVYVQESRVVGATPLIGHGPMGEMRADSYEILDGGKSTVLIGNVWTRINESTEISDSGKTLSSLENK